MSVNWNTFERNVTDAIKSRKAKNSDDFAKIIADEYNQAVLNNAQDLILGNRLLSANKSILTNALKSAFESAKVISDESRAKATMKSLINGGILAYWIGANLSLLIPPPGAVNVVSNVVTAPGIPPNISITNTSNIDVFVKELSTKFRLHLLTISGITSGVSATGAPIVIPFNGLN